jgi:Domain of unknown function (DUF4188)
MSDERSQPDGLRPCAVAANLTVVAINRGRWTVSDQDEVVVFLIGMRINKPWKVKQWWPVFTSMPKMLRWLDKHPQAGLLHYEFALKSPLSPVVIQYWRSFEELEHFARSPQAPHLPAWKAFNASVGGSGDVGIWHETYRAADGQREVIYGNMPPVGLAGAMGAKPIGSTAESAARRIGARTVDEPPVVADY